VHELRAECPRGVHRRARERPAHQDVERDREADREARDRPERATRISGGREDQPDQEERQEELDHGTLPRSDPAAEQRRAELRRVDGAVRQHPRQKQGGQGAGEELRSPVDRGQHRLDSSGDEEAERDRRVEVAAGDMADGRGHHGDHEPVRERDCGEVAATGGRDRAG
jgi:hypothetical protein